MVTDFGDIGSVTGQTLQQLSTQFGIPLDVLAQKMGLTNDQLEKQFDQDVAAATAAIDTATNTKYTNELLADILAQAQGLAMPFSAEQLQDAYTQNDRVTGAPTRDRPMLPFGRYGLGQPTPVTPQPIDPINTVHHAENINALNRLGDKVDVLNRHFEAVRLSAANIDRATAKTATNTGMQRPTNNNTRPQSTVRV